jgi:hypothetical protein
MSQISTGNDDLDHAGNGSAPGYPEEAAEQTKPRKWSDLTVQQQRIAVVAVVVHAIIVTLTLRDLRRRPAEAVRGPKLLWGIWAMLNTTGSLAYWIFGRRRPA